MDQVSRYHCDSEERSEIINSLKAKARANDEHAQAMRELETNGGNDLISRTAACHAANYHARKAEWLETLADRIENADSVTIGNG